MSSSPARPGPKALAEDPILDRCLRDGRIFDICEGAGEIQRLIIARSILGYTNRDLRQEFPGLEALRLARRPRFTLLRFIESSRNR